MSSNRPKPKPSPELEKELARRKRENHRFSVYIAESGDIKDEKSTPVYEFVDETGKSLSDTPKNYKGPRVTYRLVPEGAKWNESNYEKILALDLGSTLLSYQQSAQQNEVVSIKAAEKIKTWIRQASEKNILVVLVSRHLDPKHVSLKLRKKIANLVLAEAVLKELGLGQDIGYFCYANNEPRRAILEYLRKKHLYYLDDEIGRKSTCLVSSDINNHLSSCNRNGFSTVNIKNADADRLIQSFVDLKNYFPQYDEGHYDIMEIMEYQDRSSTSQTSRTSMTPTAQTSEKLPATPAPTPAESVLDGNALFHRRQHVAQLAPTNTNVQPAENSNDQPPCCKIC